MKEHKYNKTGTRQIVSSGWKEFDRQTNCISTGNVYASTQFSSFVRPYAKTDCNGFKRAEGELLNYDIKPFSKYGIPERIKDVIEDKERKDSVILYMFFTRNREKAIEPFYWLVTGRDHNKICGALVSKYKTSLSKRILASHEIESYVTQ